MVLDRDRGGARLRSCERERRERGEGKKCSSDEQSLDILHPPNCMCCAALSTQ
jgi:hypothetical protein